MLSMKSLAKAIVQKCAEFAGPHRWSGRSPRLWVLTYHRIIPELVARQECEEPGMYVTPHTFARHLMWVRERLEVVALSDWVLRAAHGRPLPSRACAITFDDGWQDNYEYAFPLLSEAGMPATVFAVSGYVGTQRAFWPNRIARIVSGAPEVVSGAGELEWMRDVAQTAGLNLSHIPADREAFSRLIAACKVHPDAWLHQALDVADSLAPRLQPRRAMLDWEELGHMLQSGVFDIGSHTRTHQRLVEGLDQMVLEDEVVGSRRELERHLGVSPSLFCYPNGDSTPTAESLVAKTYLAAVTTRRGINEASTPRASLYRVGLHEDASRTRPQFIARLAGWL